MTFLFSSKETYLAYRVNWKQRYLEQVCAVRVAKQGIRDANKDLSKGGFIEDIWEAYRSLQTTKETITNLLTELQEARLEASRQVYEKRHTSRV